MGFKGTRGIFIIGGILFAAVILLVLAVSGGGSKGSAGTYGKTLTCTLNAEVGIGSIIVTNHKTGDPPWQVLPIWLPYSFNITSSDTLTFQCIPKEGFQFNVWVLNTGFRKSDNPYTVIPTAPFSLTAQFIPDPRTQP